MADRLCLDRWFTLSNGQGQVLLRAQLGVSVGDMVGVGRREQRAVWLTTFLSVYVVQLEGSRVGTKRNGFGTGEIRLFTSH